MSLEAVHDTEVAMIDEIDIEVAKPGKQVLGRFLSRLKRQVEDAQFKLRVAYEMGAAAEDRHVKEIQARDATIRALEHAARDAKPTPEQIAQMVGEHQKVRDAAMLIMGRDATLDGQTIEEMHRTVVSHKMGDKAKNMNAAELRAAFDALRLVDAGVQLASTEQGREQAQQEYEEQLGARRAALYDSLRGGRRA